MTNAKSNRHRVKSGKCQSSEMSRVTNVERHNCDKTITARPEASNAISVSKAINKHMVPY